MYSILLSEVFETLTNTSGLNRVMKTFLRDIQTNYVQFLPFTLNPSERKFGPDII